MADMLKSLGIESTLLASLRELPETLQKIAVSGILLEVVTTLKASQLDREAVHELLELYPFARFKRDGDEVVVLGKERSLAGFVDECQQFKARTIRQKARTIRYLAVYLSAAPAFEDAEKVVTINVSDGGCFVYSVRDWGVGDRVWLRYPGDNEATTCGTVRSWQPWGNNKCIPGIGVKLGPDEDDGQLERDANS
jgi:hypothetical protein